MIVARCKHPGCFSTLPCKRGHSQSTDYKTDEEKRFYGGSRWKRIRGRYRSEHLLCEICESQGKLMPGTCVDHIVAIRDGGDPYDVDNFQTLCDACHNRKRQHERRGDKLS